MEMKSPDKENVLATLNKTSTTQALSTINKMNNDLQEKLNANAKQVAKKDEEAAKILREMKPGQSISIKDIKKIYGPNWRKVLPSIPLPGETKKRDKKKAKQVKKSRRQNRRKK